MITTWLRSGTVKDYVHRVGRTARAGNKGRALLFLNPCESSYIETLNEKGVNISQIKYEGCMEMLKKVYQFIFLAWNSMNNW